MMTLHLVNPESVKLVQLPPEDPYRFITGKFFVLINREGPGFGSMQPKDLSQLGIRAVTLNIINNAKLGIVLPVRNRSFEDLDPETRKSGFTMASFDSRGIFTDTYIPNTPDPDYLMKMLGLKEGTLPGGMRASGGSFDQGVGFPDATHSLANRLSGLERYLFDLANDEATRETN